MENEGNAIENPTFVGIKCPTCAGEKFIVEGASGSKASSFATTVAFGAVGHMVKSHRLKEDVEIKPVNFKCRNCKTKFDSLPKSANKDEILKEPCTITFKRLSSFVGGAVKQQVFLNGAMMGIVNNNSEITFDTYTKTNVIFVTDHFGNIIKEDFKFIAESGGKQEIKFKNKFIFKT